MNTETSLVERKRGGCCSGRKQSPEKLPDLVPPKPEITPIIKPEGEQGTGCQCCARSEQEKPAEGLLFELCPF